MHSKRLLISVFAISMHCGFAQDSTQALREAERLADLYNWYDALPHFEFAEQAFRARGDRRNEAYARIGRLRGQMQVLSLPDLADTLERLPD
ncbi:MAG: hypothetical protein IPJ98_00665 [Bryobacterales bacterium]|nr:hypothetical protein [Bryobacterales bacterium]